MAREGKYEQALKAAAQWHKDGTDTVRAVVECIFPELHESEDERIRRDLIRDIDIAMPVETAQKYIAWLEKQGKQKHAWSEEDERMISGIIDEIQANKDTAPPYDIPIYEGFLDWLKSLKPQNRWRPSEEQMQALETAIICRTMPWEQLGTLYNDLKKL